MSLWRAYRRRRELVEGLADGGSPEDRYRFNTDDADHAPDYEKARQELFRVVLGKYPNETMDFFNTLAGRGDEEVASLLRKVRRDAGPKLPHEPRHPSDANVVVPPAADTGHNPEYQGDE